MKAGGEGRAGGGYFRKHQREKRTGWEQRLVSDFHAVSTCFLDIWSRLSNSNGLYIYLFGLFRASQPAANLRT